MKPILSRIGAFLIILSVGCLTSCGVLICKTCKNSSGQTQTTCDESYQEELEKAGYECKYN